VFQIFSQLIELRPAPLPSSYMQMLRPLLSPVLWERPGNIPPLVRLIKAYLSKAAQEIVQSATLEVSLTATPIFMFCPQAWASIPGG
jgi:exportin-2 (importin alpha re-exporter)